MMGLTKKDTRYNQISLRQIMRLVNLNDDGARPWKNVVMCKHVNKGHMYSVMSENCHSFYKQNKTWCVCSALKIYYYYDTMF